MPQPAQPSKIRWWPFVVLVCLYIGFLVYVWTGEGLDRQNQTTKTLGLSILLAIGSVGWLLFFARLSARTRWIVLLGSMGLTALGAFAIEIRGVSGDLIPILAWRWSPRTEDLLYTQSLRAVASTETKILETAHDFPGYLGPRGDGVLKQLKLSSDWQHRPPQILWRIPVGLGWSGFAIVNTYAVTMEQRGPQEMVTCYDLVTGKMRWQHGVETRHEDGLGGDGPRSTPAISSGKVYSLGAKGDLLCLNLADGHQLWAVNVLEENNAVAPRFGVSTSPVVVDDRLLIVAGGPAGHSLVVYDRHSGIPLFSGGDDPAGYSTPVPTQIAGVDQYLVFNGEALVGYDAGDAAELWRYPWPKGSENVSQPIPLADQRVFLSSGYGIGGRLIQIKSDGEQFAFEQIWASLKMKAKFTNIIHRDGYLYGLDDGVLACIDVAQGERHWKQGRYGHGQILLVDDLLLVLGERGELALVAADPKAYRELARLNDVLHGKTWNPPALSRDHLLVRNSSEAVCLKLPLE